MQEEAKINFQNQRFAEALQLIKPNVTGEDRKKAVEEIGVVPSTVVNYLNGRVKDCEIAAKLLKLFRKRIAEREKVLQSA